MKTATWFQMMIMGFQYMRGRKLRTLLTTVAVVFGVGMIFAFNLVLPSAMKSLQNALESEGDADLDISSVTGEAFLPEQPIQTVAEIEGVQAVTGVLQRQVVLPEDFNPDYDQIVLVGVDPSTIQQVQEYDLKAGRFLSPDDRGVMVVQNGVAEEGDSFTLLTTSGSQTYKVVGVLEEEPLTPDMPRLLISLTDAQTILKQPGLINMIQVRYARGVNEDQLTLDIEKKLGSQYVTNPESDVFAAMEVAVVALNMFAMIALFLGGFLIFNTFRTVVLERQHDLGMLRAIGATRRQIMQLILIESLIQGVIGTIIGLIAGFVLALFMTDFMVDIWQQFAGNSMQVALEFNATALFLAIFMGVGVTLLAGYLPARSASRTSPLDALRPATISVVHRAARWGLYLGSGVMIVAFVMLIANTSSAPVGALLFLVGAVIAAPGLVVPAARLFEPILSLWFSREGDIARSNMVRQPGRASITASTLMIGLAVLIAITAIMSAVNILVDDMLDSSFDNDVLLMPPAMLVYNNLVGADEGLKKDLMALSDVETVSDWRFASSAHEGNRIYVFGIDPVTYPQVTDLEFNEGNPEEAYAALASGRGAIINSLTALQLGVKVGDEFELQTAEGPKNYRVAGIANDVMNMKILTFMISQDNIAADFHKTESILFMIKLTPGVDEQKALSQIKAAAKDYPQFEVTLTRSYRDEMTQIVTGAMNVYYVLAALILIPAALGLLNTLTINILERTREIGVVRAIGASRMQVQRMIIAEALILGLFGASLGILAGVVMSYGFISAFSIIGWEMHYIFPVMGIIAAVIIAVMLALFASVLPARNAAKLDIIRALQYE